MDSETPPPHNEPPDRTAADTPAGAAEPAAGEGVETMQRLDPRLVPYWIITNLISTAVVGGGVIAGAFYLRVEKPEYAHETMIVALGFGGLLLLLSLLQPVLAYATWRYALGGDLMIARYGILFREEKTIPISRLQHVDLRRGPIERLFSLSTLVVFTAGTEGATFRVPGLAVTRAREMRDRILAARGDDVI